MSAADWVALLGGVGGFVAGIVAAIVTMRRSSVSAKKSDLDRAFRLIDELQEELKSERAARAAQDTRHEKEREEWRKREVLLMRRIDELEAIVTPNKRRTTGPLS